MTLENIYAHPYRVYICFFILIIAGVFCYQQMPVSLFPNSSKPVVVVGVPYDNYTRDGFLNTYGKTMESHFKRLQSSICEVEKVESNYENDRVFMDIHFNWGNDATICHKEIEQILLYYKSQWPDNMRYGSWAWLDSKSVGYFLGSFYSDKRDAEEIYNILNDLITPKLTSLKEVNTSVLYNPKQTQITITLDPHKMAAFKLLPEDVFTSIRSAVKAHSGGILHNKEQTIIVEFEPQAKIVEHFRDILIPVDNNQTVLLSEIANINLQTNNLDTQVFKINGEPSIILYVAPVVGRNIKDMCDKVLAIVQEALQLKAIPDDIKFVALINPGDFIKAAVANIMHEVWLCSFIAVLVLFIFIGSFSGTLTTLMEIPISVILSFILMKLTNIQLNLISLGGLALSVGMNVDASVVVIDAIIKKLNKANTIAKNEIIKLVALAVREVFTPVILATITSLIVFIPLIFTSKLTYAILGDLAKTVIYSHGLSMFIALILVPTIRIHIATSIGVFNEQHRIPKINLWLNKLYEFYSQSLQYFLDNKKLRMCIYSLSFVSIILVLVFIPTNLTREIICSPDTNIIDTNIYYQNSAHISQVEEKNAIYEQLVQDKYSKDIAYIFTHIHQINSGGSAIVLRDKSQFKKMLINLQELTKDSNDVFYTHTPYNPSELPIPKPPDWRVEFISNDIDEANKVLDKFTLSLREANIVENINTNTNTNSKYLIKPFTELFQKMQKLKYKLQATDLAKIVTLTNTPIRLDHLTINDKDKDIIAMYPEHAFTKYSALKSLPIPVGDKIVPLRALANFELLDSNRTLTRFNGENYFRLEGYLNENEKPHHNTILAKLRRFTEDFANKTLTTISDKVSIKMVDAKVELTQAIHELMITTLLSLILIFLALYLRFSSVIHTLIIMLAIPFGILGVFLSLWIFNSTLSLNSALGIILLNGITVANSIMLVEKILKYVAKGEKPRQAILLTAKERIRPILMTSIITIFGMLPIACGFGEGGKVLQPLGIAVAGGLWVSLIFTLYIIPALEYMVLSFAKDLVET